MEGRKINIEPCGGDGASGGQYGRARLLASLIEFLKDPINFKKVKDAMSRAPYEDQGFLQEVVENLSAGIDPGNQAIDAVVEHGGIHCGLIFRNGGVVEVDAGFRNDEPWE